MNDLHSLEVILSTLLILGIYFSYKMNLLFFFFLFSLLHDAYFLTLRHPSSTEVSLFLHSVQFSSVAQSCPTLCDPMNRSTPGLPVYHQLPEFTQTQVH